jgi:ribosomal-protein-alanine N-acetyltransferase
MMTKTPSRARISIRWAVRRDAQEILAIENATSNHPWSEGDFLRELQKRNVIGMVAEDGDRIVGFMVYELRRRSIRILSFAACPTFSRQGVGTQMIAKLIGKLSQERRSTLALYVRETNLAGQLFFQKLGFLATKVVRGHYDDTNEAAYAMEYCLDAVPVTKQEVSIDA